MEKDYPFNFVHSEGFYCPEGGEGPVPCPRGTFGPSFWATFINDCISCPPHHYGPRESLSSCLPCGPWSQQPLPGQDSCTCLQEGQVFQVTAYYIVYIRSHAFVANCGEAICRPLLRQTLMFQPSGVWLPLSLTAECSFHQLLVTREISQDLLSLTDAVFPTLNVGQ